MKMKQGLKKLFALCLVLSMVLGISVPTVANAEEGSNVIDVVEVNGVQEAVVGVVASDAMTIPEGANYVVDEGYSGWYDWTAEEGEKSWLKNREGETVFENGRKYEMNIRVTPNEGYVLTEDTVMKINGEIVDAYVNVNDQYVDWYKEYSFLDQIDKVEVTNVPTAEIGGKATTQGIKVPEGANYEITHTGWYEIPRVGEHVRLEEGAVFEKGKAYRLQITVEAKVGCEMTYDYEVTVDGEEPEEYWGIAPLQIFQYYSFLEKIDEVEVNNVPTATVGGKATTEGMTVPEGANYEINYEYTQWYDAQTYETVEDGTEFEDGKKYELCIYVEPKDGYEFPEDAVVVVNGKEVYESVLVWEDGIDIYLEYSFLEQIDKIEIKNDLPDAKVGETAGAGELEVPEDAKYTVTYAWFYDNLNNEYEGQFATGNTYMLAVVIQSKDGCEFTEDVEVTIDGKPLDTPFVTNQGYIYLITEIHDLGNNAIDKIEITATEPKAGEKISTDNVTVPEDAKYEILYVAWCNAKTGREVTGTFEEGKQYKLVVAIATDEGVYLANDVKILLNGKEFTNAKFANGAFNFPFYATCELGFDLTVVDNNQNNNNTNNNTQNNSNQNTAITPSPATGDNVSLILWIALAVIAMTGMAVVVSRKRYEV